MAPAWALPPSPAQIVRTAVALDEDRRDDAPTVRFTNIEDLFEAVKQVRGDFLIVQSIFPQSQIFKARDS